MTESRSSRNTTSALKEPWLKSSGNSKHSDEINESWLKPSGNSKQSGKMNEPWRKLSGNSKQSEEINESWLKPSGNSKQSGEMNEPWHKPSGNSKHSGEINEPWRKPSGNSKHSGEINEPWRKPSGNSKQSEEINEPWRKPSGNSKQSEEINEPWRKPSGNSKQSEEINEPWLKSEEIIDNFKSVYDIQEGIKKLSMTFSPVQNHQNCAAKSETATPSADNSERHHTTAEGQLLRQLKKNRKSNSNVEDGRSQQVGRTSFKSANLKMIGKNEEDTITSCSVQKSITLSSNPSSLQIQRPQLDSRAYAVRKYFEKAMNPKESSDKTVCSNKKEAMKFVASMVAYDPKSELLYHMADEQKLGGQRISEIVSFVTSPIDVKDLVFPMLECFLDPILDAPLFKINRDRILCQFYHLPFFIEKFAESLTKKDTIGFSERNCEIVVQFLSILSLSLMEARSSAAIRNMATFLSESSISGIDRLCTILMIDKAKREPYMKTGILSHNYNSSRVHRSCFGASDRAPPGGRHNNDFLNYRDIAIVPTSEEIACITRPYLPLASKENRFNGISSNTAYFLDSQFRLLREDFLSPLRQAAVSDKKLLGAIPINVHLDHKPCIIFKFDKPTLKSRNGKENTDLSDYWSKFRGLEYESLISLQRNGENVRFGTIAMSNGEDDKWLNHPDGPRIGIEFERKEDLNETLEDLCDMAQCVPYEIVSASQSFFSYRSVLTCLQKMTSIPLEEEIVDGISTNIRPDYIPQYLKLPSDFNSIDLNLDAWRDAPLLKGTKLDQSQIDALHLALTNRVAIIQGPPGSDHF